MIRRLLIAMLFAAFLVPSAQAKAPRIGEPAPEVQLTLVNGSKVALSQLRGQVVVINLWATWCVPCRAELPTLDAYYRAQRSHGLRVFAATTEDSVPEPMLRRLFAAMAVDAVHRLKGPYVPMKGVPTNYVIDRAGVVRYAAAGAFDLDALNRVLVPLLRETAPPALASSVARR